MKTNFRLLAPVLFLMLCSSDAMAGNPENWICITNETSDQKLILVEDIDSFDWNGFRRPDHNWNGRELEPENTICQQADINTLANSVNFSFVINGTDQVHKFRMKYIVDGYEGWMVLLGRDPSSSILRGAKPSSSNRNYEIGRNCGRQDVFCSGFFIRDVP